MTSLLTPSRVPPRRRRPHRLTDETIGGIRRSPAWVDLMVLGAGMVDRGLAGAGLSRPVLVVSGFWRSGTTWVQECFADSLGAKTVFEPLSPQEPRRRAMLRRGHLTEDVLQAIVPAASEDPAFWTLLRSAAYCHRGSRFTLSCRRRLWDSFRRGIVLKDVRLHRNLQATHQCLATPVIHVRRHPCGVVASLRAARWHWNFERVSLVDLLPTDELTATVRQCDRTPMARLVAFWAVHEKAAAAALRGQAWACEITYEAMVAAPREVMARTSERLDLHPVRPASPHRPSATIDPAAFAGRADRTAERWRETLTVAEISQIEDVASSVYPGWRAHWDP